MNYTCEICGKTFHARPSRKNVRFCSWECTKAERATRKMQGKCLNCGKSFVKYDSNIERKYCSISCGISARNQTEQNPSYHRDISGENNPMYGRGQTGSANGMHGRYGALNPAWRGGRKIRKDGYILVRAPANHSKAGEYILEHRLIMETHIGRELEPYEVVHHIDMNPSNNDIGNLRLYSSQAEHIKDAHT